jgi:hypothetical protein
MFRAVLIMALSYPMLAVTGLVVHINPDRSHSGTENGHKIVSITRLPKSKSHPWRWKQWCILTSKMSKHKGGNVGASLAIFLGFTVSGIHFGFPTLDSTSSFLLALQSWKPPASSAVFPVTVTTFCVGWGTNSVII